MVVLGKTCQKVPVHREKDHPSPSRQPQLEEGGPRPGCLGARAAPEAQGRGGERPSERGMGVEGGWAPGKRQPLPGGLRAVLEPSTALLFSPLIP